MSRPTTTTIAEAVLERLRASAEAQERRELVQRALIKHGLSLGAHRFVEILHEELALDVAPAPRSSLAESVLQRLRTPVEPADPKTDRGDRRRKRKDRP